MLNFTRLSFSVLLVFAISFAAKSSDMKTDSRNEVNDDLSFIESATGFTSMFLSTNHYPGAYNRDGFFRRLFRKNKSVAERNTRSKAHSTKKQHKYVAPQSNSQIPMGGSSNGGPATNENTAVQNFPKEPLQVSRRNQSTTSIPKWQLGLSVGSSHAVADIGNSKNMDFGDFVNYQTANVGLNFGLYTKYMFNTWFAASFGMDYGNYKGTNACPTLTDSDYFGYRFENDIFEFFAKTEFHAPFLYDSAFDLYLLTGIGVFFNDVKLYNSIDRKETIDHDFSQIQPSIPVGLGFGYLFNNQIRVGYELGYRYTIFNYFDGVGNLSSSHDRYFSNALKISIGF